MALSERAVAAMSGTVREVRMKTATTILLITAIIAGCGNKSDENKSGADTEPGLSLSVDGLEARLDKAGEEGFYCRISDSIVVSWFPGMPGNESSMWDSFYANYVGYDDKGLEILTTGGVSYARWTAGTESIETTERRELVERLDGEWATWGQPDTVALEELPSSPSGCLEWVSVTQYSDLREETPGRWTLKASLNNGETTSKADGYMRTEGDDIVEFVLKPRGVSAVNDVINVKYERPTSLPIDKPEDVVELSQDEYMTLVSG
jgi:hypothetical protein